MNYRHAFHAGNFADVVKHAVLARILVHLRDKETPFRVIDTHAGAGLYDLTGGEAQRTGEWRDGIGRLIGAPLAPALAALLAPYRDAVVAVNGGETLHRYPGSPLLALRLMRPQDRLTACELEPAAAAALAGRLRRDRRATAVTIDGWVALNAYVPPKERRGVVIVDPPYEADGEFPRLARATTAAYRKWASGIYLLWYPVKDRRGPNILLKELRAGGIEKILRVELHLAAAKEKESTRLNGAGVLVINPPWRLADELAQLLPALAELLRPGRGNVATVDWIAAEPSAIRR